MRIPGHRLTQGLGLLALGLAMAACTSRGYRSDSYYPSGYVYYPSYLGQGGVSNGYYYGPRNERDRPASETDFDWTGTTRRP